MKNVDQYPPTPELDKMKEIAPFSQKIGEFLDIFLTGKGVELCKYQESGNNGKPKYRWKEGVKITKLDKRPTNGREPKWEDVFNLDAEKNPEHQSWAEGYYAIHTSIQKLLAEFFEIDLTKCEQERRAILDYLHNQQK